MTKVERMLHAFLQYPNYTVGEGEDSTTFLEVINYLADQVPRVLSLKQLRELEGTYHFIWVETNGEPDCFNGYAEVTTNYMSKAVELFSFGNEVEWIPSNDRYGKTWRCWNLKPDEDQMENTPWE